MPEKERQLNLSHVSKEDKNQLCDDRANNVDEPQTKKAKLSYKEKKKLKGQNKARGPTFQRDCTKELCMRVLNNLNGTGIEKCDKKECSFLHDVEEYLKIKPKDVGPTCYNYELSGNCLWGVTCQFGSTHITAEGKNVVDEKKYTKYQMTSPHIKNHLPKELQMSLKKKKYNFELTEKIISYNDSLKKNQVSSMNIL